MLNVKMTKNRAIFYLAVTAVLWSSCGVLIKSISWNPLAITSIRGLLAGLCIWALLPNKFNYKNLTFAHGISGVSLLIMSACFTTAMTYTTAANAIVLLFSAPIWVAIIAPFMVKERTSLLDWLFIIIIMAGIILFFMDSMSLTGYLGIVLGIISGFFFALQIMSLRLISLNSPGSAIVYGNFLTFFVFLPFCTPPWPNAMDLLALLAMGIFQVGFCYYLYTLAIPYVNALELLMITMLEPILTPIVTFLVLGEKPGRFAFWGGLIVIISVSIWTWLKNKPSKERDTIAIKTFP
ncbi:MAG: DMT family transporter [Deltaproteobacteria bacterium]|jgi:drug/metabolite transporter (DMT)-like permease|nr:DMT family transporter [Deltaproteobacteria bacterium]